MTRFHGHFHVRRCQEMKAFHEMDFAQFFNNFWQSCFHFQKEVFGSFRGIFCARKSIFHEIERQCAKISNFFIDGLHEFFNLTNIRSSQLSKYILYLIINCFDFSYFSLSLYLPMLKKFTYHNFRSPLGAQND